MKVEVQCIVSEMIETTVEISEKEIIDAIKQHENFHDMSMHEALEYIALQKVFESHKEYDDIEVDHVRILK